MAEPRTHTSHKQPPPPPRPVEVMEDPWRPMKDAPKDGTYVLFKGDPCGDKDPENQWYWYKTRKFQMGTWRPCGWWRRRFGPNVPPSFTPGGWRYAKDGLP